MKVIKIGSLNWDVPGWKDNGPYYIGVYILSILNSLSNKYKYEYIQNPYNEECDIVIYSLWGKISHLKKCKGNPIFIYWTHEYLAYGGEKQYLKNRLINNKGNFILNRYKQNNYSISFLEDNETNLYYPYWVTEYDRSIYLYEISLKNNYRNIKDKNKFCVFCASNKNLYNAQVRFNLVDSLNNYKQVDCCGSVLHNTDDFYLPYDDIEAQKYCKDHKFYVSFENAKSKNPINYVTEKLLFGWKFACIPLYWGNNEGLKYFNHNAFINLSNCNQNEMINKIIELDNDDEQCQYILNQYLFADKTINYQLFFNKKLLMFIENIINK